MSERPVTPIIAPGRFVWHELNTKDVGKSAVFYGESDVYAALARAAAVGGRVAFGG